MPMRFKRLVFAIQHLQWQWQQWAAVIWTDETSIVLKSVRGRIRVWHKPKKQTHPTVICRRWTHYSNFMLWGCYSYYMIGPCFIWFKEPVEENKQNALITDALNEYREPICKNFWEEKNQQEDEQRQQEGESPLRRTTWKFTKETGKWARGKTGGGIDWFRYARHVLQDQLLPFAREHKKKWPDTIVVEDGATPHTHSYHEALYSYSEIEKVLWPGNSPDINMIEPVWADLKREIRKAGPIHSKEEAIEC